MRGSEIVLGPSADGLVDWGRHFGGCVTKPGEILASGVVCWLWGREGFAAKQVAIHVQGLGFRS